MFDIASPNLNIEVDVGDWAGAGNHDWEGEHRGIRALGSRGRVSWGTSQGDCMAPGTAQAHQLSIP